MKTSRNEECKKNETIHDQRNLSAPIIRREPTRSAHEIPAWLIRSTLLANLCKSGFDFFLSKFSTLKLNCLRNADTTCKLTSKHIQSVNQPIPCTSSKQAYVPIHPSIQKPICPRACLLISINHKQVLNQQLKRDLICYCRRTNLEAYIPYS